MDIETDSAARLQAAAEAIAAIVRGLGADIVYATIYMSSDGIRSLGLHGGEAHSLVVSVHGATTRDAVPPDRPPYAVAEAALPSGLAVAGYGP